MIVKIKIFPDIPILTDKMNSKTIELMIGLVMQARAETVFRNNRFGPPETHSQLLIEDGYCYFIPTVNLLGAAFEKEGPLYGALSAALSMPVEFPGLVLAPDDVNILVFSPENGFSFRPDVIQRGASLAIV